MWLPVTLLRQTIEYRITLGTVAISFISSIAVFALIYVVCIRFEVSVYVHYFYANNLHAVYSLYECRNNFFYVRALSIEAHSSRCRQSYHVNEEKIDFVK